MLFTIPAKTIYVDNLFCIPDQVFSRPNVYQAVLVPALSGLYCLSLCLSSWLVPPHLLKRRAEPPHFVSKLEDQAGTPMKSTAHSMHGLVQHPIHQTNPLCPSNSIPRKLFPTSRPNPPAHPTCCLLPQPAVNISTNKSPHAQKLLQII